MPDMEEMRGFVHDLYPGPRWWRRVKNMSDAQVIAIYMREQNKKDPQPKDKESGDNGIPF